MELAVNLKGYIEQIALIEKWKTDYISNFMDSFQDLIKFQNKLKKFKPAVFFGSKKIVDEKHKFLTMPFIKKVGHTKKNLFDPKLNTFFADAFYRMFKPGRFVFKNYELSESELYFVRYFALDRTCEDMDNRLCAAYEEVTSHKKEWKTQLENEKKLIGDLLMKFSKEGKKSLVKKYRDQFWIFDYETNLDNVIVNLSISDVDLKKRKFMLGTAKAATVLGVGGGLILSSKVVGNLIEDVQQWKARGKEAKKQEELDKAKKLLEHYRKQPGVVISGNVITKSFSMPYFLDNEKIIGSATKFSIPFLNMYKLFEEKRKTGFFDVFNYRKPSKLISEFAHTIYNSHQQITTFLAQGYKEEDINSTLFDIWIFLSLISKNVEYVSDYKSLLTKDKKVIQGLNRDKFDVYYDKKDYYKYPEQTLIDGYGDCEDFTLLAMALIKSIWNTKSFSTYEDVEIPNLGMVILTNQGRVKDDSDHVIMCVEADINFVHCLLRHYKHFSDVDTSFSSMRVYSPKKLGGYIDYTKNFDTQKWDKNNRFIVCFEPQNYHIHSSWVNLPPYIFSYALMDNGKHYVLEKDFIRVHMEYFESKNGEQGIMLRGNYG